MCPLSFLFCPSTLHPTIEKGLSPMRKYNSDGSWDEEVGDRTYHYDRHGHLVGKTEHNDNGRDYESDKHLQQIGWSERD